jgi:hypothetical protein
MLSTFVTDENFPTKGMVTMIYDNTVVVDFHGNRTQGICYLSSRELQTLYYLGDEFYVGMRVRLGDIRSNPFDSRMQLVTLAELQPIYPYEGVVEAITPDSAVVRMQNGSTGIAKFSVAERQTMREKNPLHIGQTVHFNLDVAAVDKSFICIREIESREHVSEVTSKVQNETRTPVRSPSTPQSPNSIFMFMRETNQTPELKASQAPAAPNREPLNLDVVSVESTPERVPTQRTIKRPPSIVTNRNAPLIAVTRGETPLTPIQENPAHDNLPGEVQSKHNTQSSTDEKSMPGSAAMDFSPTPVATNSVSSNAERDLKIVQAIQDFPLYILKKTYERKQVIALQEIAKNSKISPAEKFTAIMAEIDKHDKRMQKDSKSLLHLFKISPLEKNGGFSRFIDFIKATAANQQQKSAISKPKK